MNSLSIIVRHSRIFCERKLQGLDLGFPEQIILMYLFENTNINQDAIAKYFIIDKGAIAKTLSKLEEKGFIERRENPDNKREKLISLSEKGLTIIDDMREIADDWNKNIFNGLNEGQIQEVIMILEKMAKNSVESTNMNWSDDYGKKE